MKILILLVFVLLQGCGSKKEYITKEECAQQCVDVCVESIQIVSPLLDVK
jgi:hypothetical protein